MALSLGACSSDIARFGDNPFSNPFQTANAPMRDPSTTGSIKPAPKSTIGAVQSTPLASVPQSPVSDRPVAAAPRAANGMTQAQLEKAAATTGSIAPSVSAPAARAAAPVAARVSSVTGSANGWTAQGGTPVVLAHGETVETLSGRYGVPTAAILQSNGLSSASQATPGSRVIIPVYNAEAASGRKPAHQMAQAQGVADDAQRPVIPAAPRTPVAPMVQTAAKAKVGELIKPPATVDKAADAAKAKLAAETKLKTEAEAKLKREALAKAKAEAQQKATADAETAKAAKAAKLAEQSKKQVASLPAEEPATTNSLSKDADSKSDSAKGEFRWPARGRVISGFSGKGGNEGINIAVPEGTPVKAAESGTVAYAGSELKGYGNLVLIRHENGYVSAYAHNGDITVKRGEKVGRGQVIAKSGQSGNVSSPQLHFELRKGSAPIDPTPYLSN